MWNVIFMILAIPFLPFFIYGDLTQGVKQEIDKSQVLGEENQNDETDQSYQNDSLQDFQNFNLFPLDRANAASLTPIRKPDFTEIKIWAGSSVVIDVGSGTILEYYNGRKQTQIASLTKIMTAVLVMEKVGDLDEDVTITREALNVDGTVVGCPTSVFCNANRMYVGEKISARNLLKATLLNSANDAATALAIHISGTSDNFVKIMNEKAKKLGLKDTHFCTPSGLEIDGYESKCYSSAYDIARIAAYSLKYDLIWDIMRIPEEQIYSSDGKYMHQLKNTDLLINEMSNCIGGKTGFTPMAGKSLLTVATDPKKNHKIVAVVLNDENRWEDMKKLIEWSFANYEWR